MLLEDFKKVDLLSEAIQLIEKEEPQTVQSIQQMASKLPAFPGTQLKKEIDSLIKSSAELLKDFAKKAKPWAAERGYKTEIFSTILDNPEKVAKALIKKYTSSYKDNPVAFNIRDILSNIDLSLK